MVCVFGLGKSKACPKRANSKQTFCLLKSSCDLMATEILFCMQQVKQFSNLHPDSILPSTSKRTNENCSENLGVDLNKNTTFCSDS